MSTPIYAETVRATGIVPEGDPTATLQPVGTSILEMPSLAPGILYHATAIRVTRLPKRTMSVLDPAVTLTPGEQPTISAHRLDRPEIQG